MTNRPLHSSEQAKLLIFSLLMLPSIIFIVGIIPGLFLGFGLFMMKKNEDFSHIETAARNFKGYFSLILIICIIAVAFSASTYGNPEHYWQSRHSEPEWKYYEDFFASCAFAAISISYLIMVRVLFLNPLKAHSEWVPVNGIFSSKPKVQNAQTEDSEVNIIKGEKMKSYSVADELIKWAKLKEDGHISDDEFNEARVKLLKRN